ncbi:MAG: helix-turn-helix transcriptional regulator [Clostridia bacterium]|nr:helix-turn-helix transcriptional regulator [Clostridia bacterium]
MFINNFLQKHKINTLTLSIIITIIITTVTVSLFSILFYSVNIYNVVNGFFSQRIENEQGSLIKNITTLETDLNRTTNQLLSNKTVYDILSKSSINSTQERIEATQTITSMTSYYTGLSSTYFINLDNNKIYNRSFDYASAQDLAELIPLEKVIENHKQGIRVYPATEQNYYTILTTYDYRGHLVLYTFERDTLFNSLYNMDSDQYNTGVYYKGNLIFSSQNTIFAGELDKTSSKKSLMRTYTKDNYTVLTGIVPSTFRKLYQPFLMQMMLLSIVVIIICLLCVVLSSKYINAKTSGYINSLMAHSHQHHYAFIKSILQRSIRNQYIPQKEQDSLLDYFRKIEYAELLCSQIKLDRINSLLLSNSYKDIASFIQKIKLIFESHLSKFGTCIVLDLDFDSIGVVLASKEALSNDDYIEALEASKRDIEKFLSLTVTISVTDSITNPCDIVYTFFVLDRLVQYRFFNGYNTLIYDDIETEGSAEYPVNIQKQISSSLIAGDTEEFTKLLHTFFEECRKTTCSEAKNWTLELAISMLKCVPAIERGNDIISNLSLSETLEEQQKTLESYFVRSIASQEDTSLSNHTFTEKVNEIIEREYSNPDLNLSFLADTLNISAIYAGRKFKNIFNKNFTAYLSEFRIQKAAHLLVSSDQKIFEIATSCGFSSSTYFVKVFKQITSMTPIDYRKHYREEN